MRILTFILALLMAFMPDNVPPANNQQAQEVCWEDMNDVEEEAVLRTVRFVNRMLLPAKAFTPTAPRIRPRDVQALDHSPLHTERQWLTSHRLRR